MPPDQPQTSDRILPGTIVPGQPITALAPMQDVTTRSFMEVVAECGAPDYFFTEYFRVHDHSTLEKHILESIVENRTGRPVFGQFIGEDVHHLKRAAKDLSQYPVAGIDLNMGCPAPKVYRKNVGGGLLRDPQKVDEVLGALRETIPGLFTVKMRIGFEDTRHLAAILKLVEKHQVDLLSVHARTVKEMYRSIPRHEFVKQAVESVPCPVLANGDVSSAKRAKEILEQTGAAGVMSGRHAIRNPWIFRQIRELLAGQAPRPTPLSAVNAYVKRLYEANTSSFHNETSQINALKKHLNFIGLGVDPEGQFLHAARRARTQAELYDICDQFMPPGSTANFADEPHPDLKARPNRE